MTDSTSEPDVSSEPFERDKDGHPVFVIGLTMAGAVSAGAYTAGVLDYLFRAVDAHNDLVEKHRDDGSSAAPRHKVVIKSMTGASAGGMCIGLAIASLIKARMDNPGRLQAGYSFPYKTAPTETAGAAERASQQPAKCHYVLAPIFDAWVKNITLWEQKAGSQTFEGFLGTVDLDDPDKLLIGQPAKPETPYVRSVLDSTHIDEAASPCLDGINALADGMRYDFLAADLDIFITNTSLNGVVYEVQFSGKNDSYWMQKHDAVRHFRIQDLGTTAFPSPWLIRWRDKGITLDPRERDPAGHVPFLSDKKSSWYALTVSSIASGAFPLGLAPRYVDATALQLGSLDPDKRYSEGGALPLELPEPFLSPLPRPNFGNETKKADDKTPYISVDGGVINNEPFELARFAIRRSAKSGEARLLDNPREGDRADRAVIMIDPFPEGAHYQPMTEKAAEKLSSLLISVGRLLPTLISQARFKQSELLNAQEDSVYSRFLIAPSRKDPRDNNKNLRGADAIACGTLSGFSGFFDESFRAHDFVLGQRNCQRFLEKAFLLDADNPVLQLGNDHPDAAEARAKRKDGKTHLIRTQDNLTRRIVNLAPVAGGGQDPLVDPIHEPLWPVMSPAALMRLKKQAEIRFDKVAGHLVNLRAAGWVQRLFFRILWNGLPWFFAGPRKWLMEAVSRIVLQTFTERAQIQIYASFADDVRDALAYMFAKSEALSAASVIKAMKEDKENEALAKGVRIPAVADLEKALKKLEQDGLAKRTFLSLYGVPKYTLKLG
ncbi:hypothetical protein [Roseibium sp.]|uniref:hypothetical protein n=1 Tax=Roseibium sp. TaxID=1936156 RepID=UPI003BB0F22A